VLECKARHRAVEAVGCLGVLEYARRLRKSFFGLDSPQDTRVARQTQHTCKLIQEPIIKNGSVHPSYPFQPPVIHICHLNHSERDKKEPAYILPTSVYQTFRRGNHQTLFKMMGAAPSRPTLRCRMYRQRLLRSLSPTENVISSILKSRVGLRAAQIWWNENCPL
jgi:hypothetical protein